jgi:hypothetical protein
MKTKEGPVKFRVSIAGIMVAVALIAVDCGAIRALQGLPHPVGNLLILCFVPMANVLLAVLLRLRSALQRGTARPFAMGFAAAGLPALALYAALVLTVPGRVGHALTDPLAPLLPRSDHDTVRLVTIIVVGLAWSQTPVLLPALLGGWLCRRSRKRSARGPAAVPPRPLGIGRPEEVTTRLVDQAPSR